MNLQSSIDLKVLGWDAVFEQKMAPYTAEGMNPARVVRQVIARDMLTPGQKRRILVAAGVLEE